MIYKISSNENPYVLDYFEGRTDNIPALTRKNADFIEAIVHLDSNYGKDLKVTPPDKGYNPEMNMESLKGKYCGSTAYWFEEMKKPQCDFRKCVLGAIIAIDRTNSTHLEASESGRITMRDIICKHCNNLHDLLSMLNVPFDAKNHNHIISLLSIKTIARKDGKPRYNISFATKFCAYASIFLGSEVQYSKYDNIVSDALPLYMKLYLNETKNNLEYKINEYQRRSLNDEENYQYRLDVYEKYENDILRILNKLTDYRINLTRNEFDHIIWYGLKGKQKKKPLHFGKGFISFYL